MAFGFGPLSPSPCPKNNSLADSLFEFHELALAFVPFPAPFRLLIGALIGLGVIEAAGGAALGRLVWLHPPLLPDPDRRDDWRHALLRGSVL